MRSKSEEDLELKTQLEMLVQRLQVRRPKVDAQRSRTRQEPAVALHRPALESMRTLIRSSTSSMTSVPKPLKFLRPHYEPLIVIYDRMAAGPNKVQSARPLFRLTWRNSNSWLIFCRCSA
jgi:26S proteasome regulatory subunit N1